MKWSAGRPHSKEEGMEKKAYITDTERRRCREVAAAFEELYWDEDIVVLDAGNYGYVKLQYYEPPFGFSDVMVYTDSMELFSELWQEWRNSRLLALVKGTPITDLEYKQIFQCLPREKQQEIARKRRYFEKKAGIKKQREKTGNGAEKRRHSGRDAVSGKLPEPGKESGIKDRLIGGSRGPNL